MTHPLQTKHWADFRSEWGNIVVGSKLGFIIFSKVPFTKFTIGTLIKCQEPDKKTINEIKDIATRNNAVFVKLEPNVLKSQKTEDEYRKLNLRKGKTLFTPTSFWIDLKKDEETLLKSFSSKTRYNIKLATKHGVKVKIDNSEESFEKYLDLTFETASRQHFFAHTRKYHKLMWKHMHQIPTQNKERPIANLLTARYGNEIISTWILFLYDNFLYYPYGASTDKYKNVMANNLMMWESIKFGQKNNAQTFDLWGREEGKGFTKFKEGYNPKVVEFAGSWDLVINKPFYVLYQLLDKMRWFLLRLKSKILSITKS